MSELFLKTVNMSISASWIVLAVLLMRAIMRRAPKWSAVLLWGIVAIRLICPFSIESALSLIPSAETVSPEIMLENFPHIDSGISIINSTLNPIISNSFSPIPGASANPLQILIPVLSVIWVSGIAALFLYTALSYINLRRKVATAVLLKDNIYQCETVVSPFVIGIIKPRIYMPFNMSERNAELVIAHERAHISRKDHLWKPFGFLLLTLHWFNPLMWLGYVLLCRDIELACDEKVVGKLDDGQRADYSQALLNCSVNRRVISACPLAFGEIGVKQRVKSILNYKKPAFWIMLIALILCAATAVCFLTDPKDNTEHNNDIPNIVTDANIRILSVGSDKDNVSIDVLSIVKDEQGNIVLKIRWNNNSEQVINYGEGFMISKHENDSWIKLNSNGIWVLPAYPVVPLSTEDETYRNVNREKEYHLSSYYDITNDGRYRFSTEFTSDSKGTVWVDFMIDSSVIYYDSPIYDIIEYDIDNDGRTETCSLQHGFTSGLFTFILTVKEGEKIECQDIYNTRWYDLSFKEQSGKLLVQGITQGDPPETHLFEISFKDGHILLTRKDKSDEALGYW